jgi:Tfp pilus assembly protein PilO
MRTRVLLIIVLVVALLAVYGFIGMDYLNQRNQRDTYDTQIAQASEALFLMPQPPADLQERLAAANASLEEVKNAFGFNATSTEIVEMILNTANQTGVTVTPLITQAWAQVSISGQTYEVFRMNIQATGTFSQLALFIHQLETDEPKTLVIESLVIEGTQGASLLDSSQRDALPMKATIGIAVYAVSTSSG